MSSATAQKRAAFSILRFLDESLKNGTIKADDAEGIEVANQCIAEAFGIDLDAEQDQRAYGIAKSLDQLVQDAANQAGSSSAAKEVPSAAAVDKQGAEAAKSRGNQLMAKKDYQGAIDAYSEAIDKDGSNPVYWSNRAAAYSQISQHDSAVSDAREAINVDPSFSKAYSRLGHALFSVGQYGEAVEAYEKGLELDPTNATMKSSLATARSRAPAATSSSSADAAEGAGSVSPRAAGGAGANAGGAGGIPGFPGMGGGMPDLAGMMNNPAIMNMAQQMMQNGGLERMMQNPMLQQMMGGAGGGGMPDIGALMNDPEMRRLAEQFGSAMGGRPGGAGGNSGGNSDMYS
ncbi:hypothetical protein BMF94_3660 [Rhodotorula taiwanensis]|uniref:SGTA homodimerisation domain-containing protein n=1 Tax=Rhodotorula taiwanensis TaxID=741276 RepID=A0A2S5B972_9BASI|nr:hypothetical protein BMF94_3660 [Rhodotorula taiwanensis]